MNLKFIKKSFDDVLILSAYAKCSIGSEDFTSDELIVYNAFKRANPKYSELTHEELGDLFSNLDENQLNGFVNNTKGVLHEIEFVEMENSNGDTILAELYPSISNPGYDVIMRDSSSGLSWSSQLKSTDNSSNVKDWIENNDGEILVTDEIAEKLDLKSSGFSNNELKVRTEEFVDKLIDIDENDSIWNYIPGIAVISITLIIYGLWKRYKKNEISFNEFKRLTIKLTGIKVTKFVFITTLLSIPVIGQITAIILLSNFLIQSFNE